ncbi:phosphatase PAP2 family protein [Bifidobacterium simiarum]|uniref:phosphatase PAP2 family protein n=1 Tax=Bifidobacterium simiarum TaxID=2045441 RepID=UPI001BDD2048|nr:phosphatase PAP2 family protein [Bifidobacterium simiarum]MBT1166373.1 phosphatase PAP2 family protein [Bifidobacterium simiarum]
MNDRKRQNLHLEPLDPSALPQPKAGSSAGGVSDGVRAGNADVAAWLRFDDVTGDVTGSAAGDAGSAVGDATGAAGESPADVAQPADSVRFPDPVTPSPTQPAPTQQAPTQPAPMQFQPTQSIPKPVLASDQATAPVPALGRHGHAPRSAASAPVMSPLKPVQSLSEELDALTANRWVADGGSGAAGTSGAGAEAGAAANGLELNPNAVPASLRDPLTVRPRWSSVTLCVVFPILMVLTAMGVWGSAVRTLIGQQYDNLAYESFASAVAKAADGHSALAGVLTALGGNIALGPLNLSSAAIPDLLFAVAAVVVVVLRKRWRLLAQMIGFAAVAIVLSELLKHLLPRQTLDMSSLKTAGNSAPSGHVAVAAVAALALLCVVPRVFRAVVAIVGACYVTLVGLGVIADGWHRLSDVVMALLIVTATALLSLAFTGGSGMDEPGTRVSSVSVQIVGTVMIVGGLMACGYASYLIWQLAPGLAYSAKWAASASSVSASVMIAGVASLTFGLTLALRHITASPLSKLGLVGAPPAPPKRR